MLDDLAVYLLIRLSTNKLMQSLPARFYEVLKKMTSSRGAAAGHEPMELEATGGLMADYEKRKRAMDQKKGLGLQQSSEQDDRKKCSGCRKPLEGT